MTVLELFRKYDFESVLPHLDHLFVVNSGHNLSSSQVENARSFYNHWANECETKPTKYYIRLVCSRGDRCLSHTAVLPKHLPHDYLLSVFIENLERIVVYRHIRILITTERQNPINRELWDCS